MVGVLEASLLDIDSDGDLDFLYSSQDSGESGVNWYQNQDGKGKSWVAKQTIVDSGIATYVILGADFDGTPAT